LDRKLATGLVDGSATALSVSFKREVRRLCNKIEKAAPSSARRGGPTDRSRRLAFQGLPPLDAQIMDEIDAFSA
jgi:hypothetical protein